MIGVINGQRRMCMCRAGLESISVLTRRLIILKYQRLDHFPRSHEGSKLPARAFLLCSTSHNADGQRVSIR